MAVSHYIETQTGWSIKRVKTARRYRTLKTSAGNQTLTAGLRDDLRDALIKIRADGGHEIEPSRDATAPADEASE